MAFPPLATGQDSPPLGCGCTAVTGAEQSWGGRERGREQAALLGLV